MKSKPFESILFPERMNCRYLGSFARSITNSPTKPQIWASLSCLGKFGNISTLEQLKTSGISVPNLAL